MKVHPTPMFDAWAEEPALMSLDMNLIPSSAESGACAEHTGQVAGGSGLQHRSVIVPGTIFPLCTVFPLAPFFRRKRYGYKTPIERLNEISVVVHLGC
jgi:hypothetical protein